MDLVLRRADVEPTQVALADPLEAVHGAGGIVPGLYWKIVQQGYWTRGVRTFAEDVDLSRHANNDAAAPSIRCPVFLAWGENDGLALGAPDIFARLRAPRTLARPPCIWWLARRGSHQPRRTHAILSTTARLAICWTSSWAVLGPNGCRSGSVRATVNPPESKYDPLPSSLVTTGMGALHFPAVDPLVPTSPEAAIVRHAALETYVKELLETFVTLESNRESQPMSLIHIGCIGKTCSVFVLAHR